MNIQLFDKSNEQYVKEAANLLIACFPHAYGDCVFEEMNNILVQAGSVKLISGW